MLAALLAACLYIRFRRAPAVRIILFLVLLAGLYYAAGDACKLFAAACGPYEVLANWQRILGLSYFVALALIPWAMRSWPFDIAPGDAAGGLTGLNLKGGRLEMSASVALHAFYIALVVGLTLRKPLKDFGRQLLSIAPRPAALRFAGGMLSLARPPAPDALWPVRALPLPATQAPSPRRRWRQNKSGDPQGAAR